MMNWWKNWKSFNICFNTLSLTMPLLHNPQLAEHIKTLLQEQKKIKTSRSMKFPLVMPFFVRIKQWIRRIENVFQPIARGRSDFLPYINVKHQSVLLRKLGDVDMQLQVNKVKNLQIALEKINGILIQPGEIFSFWELVRKPTAQKGYLEGILISKGKVKVGIWGGLCQLGNLLYWMFLHLPVEIIERHRHSYDLFPDSGRVLPFASGATVFYNYVDLKVKNTLEYPIQIKLWTDEKYLKGQIRSPQAKEVKIHVFEEDHCFIRYQGTFWRYNTIKKTNKKWGKEEAILISENLVPVMYQVNLETLLERYEVLDIDAGK